MVRVDRNEPLELSYAQQRLWFLSQMEGVSEAYHIPFSLRLRGDLDRAAMRGHSLGMWPGMRELGPPSPWLTGQRSTGTAPVEPRTSNLFNNVCESPALETM